MPDELILQEAARWLRYAREDLEAAIELQSGKPRHEGEVLSTGKSVADAV